jgi:hypothetical protein
MNLLRPSRIGAVGAILLGTFLVLLGSGCSRESKMIMIDAAAINPPVGGAFTCWIKGDGFQSGDKVRINDPTEVKPTFGGSNLVTFSAPVNLLEGRPQLRVMVFRPNSEMHSNPHDIPLSPPRGQAWRLPGHRIRERSAAEAAFLQRLLHGRAAPGHRGIEGCGLSKGNQGRMHEAVSRACPGRAER